MRPLLIDCDPGIDDAVAISYALRSKLFEIVAITAVSGNLTADQCSRNARQILDLLDAPDIPVCEGPMRPLVRPYPRDPFFHGDDGLAGLSLPATSRTVDPRFAADMIIEQANRHEGRLEIAALGPLTNLALALIKDPYLPKKITKLTIIGGAFGFGSYGTSRATGDNPASEWNVYVDPEAAQLVFEAGFPLTAIGLDVATRPELVLNDAQRSQLRASRTPEGAFLIGVLQFVQNRGFGAYCGLIDSMAIAHLIDPTRFSCEAIRVIVERQSTLSTGQTIVERRENFAWDGLAAISAASDADYINIIDDLVGVLSASR